MAHSTSKRHSDLDTLNPAIALWAHNYFMSPANKTILNNKTQVIFMWYMMTHSQIEQHAILLTIKNYCMYTLNTKTALKFYLIFLCTAYI